MKGILVVTHGEYEGNTPNARQTKTGDLQMIRLRPLLPKDFDKESSFIICGGGKRHLDACEKLLEKFPSVISPFAGRKEVECKGEIIFPNGERKSFKDPEVQSQYKQAVKETSIWLKSVLIQGPPNTIIVGGRILLIAAGMKREKAKSGALYLLELTEGEKITFKELKK